VEHSLGAGVDYSHESQFSPVWQAVGGPSTDLYNPDSGRTATAAQTPYRAANNPYGDARIGTFGLYLFDTAKLTERWFLSGSGRLERYDTRYRSLAAATIAAPTPTVATLEADGTLFSWKSGLNFKPKEEGSIYFSYGNSHTPPGSTFNLSAAANNQNNPNLDPIEARNFELGTKWDFFKGRLSTSLALFRAEQRNLTDTDQATQTITQGIREETYGVEFGVSGELARNWFVHGGFGYSDGERIVPATSVNAAQNGANLRFQPDWSANLWSSYKLPFGLTLGGGFYYSGAVSRSTSNTAVATGTSALEIDRYIVFNAMAACDVTKNLSVQLNVNNVFDTEAAIRLNNNGGRYYPGTPRSFVLAANLRF
jgi:catecholate siderophore receptor